ncbi:MAG: hypothetical protein HY861_01700 [Chlamydiia bacterium]|nr:hypothetical protein [Chlamydiia bacterium]
MSSAINRQEREISVNVQEEREIPKPLEQLPSCAGLIAAIAWRILLGGTCSAILTSMTALTMPASSSDTSYYLNTVFPGAAIAFAVGGLAECAVWIDHQGRMYNLEEARTWNRAADVPIPSRPIHPINAMLVYAVSGAVVGTAFGAHATAQK